MHKAKAMNRNEILTKITASLTIMLIAGLMTFFFSMNEFKTRTEIDIENINKTHATDVARLTNDLEKKADQSMQAELKKQLEKIDEKLDLIIMQK